MTCRTWTVEEDAYLVDHYARQTLQQIGATLGRTWQSVQQRVNILIRDGKLVRSERHYQPPWSQEQDDILADHWGLLPDATVARHLGRSVIACQIRAKRQLKLARQHQFYTARTVAKLLGVDDHVVIRWIAAGVLRGRKSVVRCGDNRQMWRIDDQDLQAFIRRYPWHYDRTQIEWGTWWRRLAERVYAADPWLTCGQAAIRLGVVTKTVLRWIRQGKIRAEWTWDAGKFGGYRIRESVLASVVVPKWGSTGKKLPRQPRPVITGARLVRARLRNGRFDVIAITPLEVAA